MSASKIGFLTVTALVPAATLWAIVSHTMTLGPESRVWIEGTSTLRSFTCEATAVEAEVLTAAPGAAAAVLAGRKAVSGATVRIPAQRLDCRNGTMNEHMLKALEAADHPSISFQLSSYELGASPQPLAVRLEGVLSMGGSERPVTIEASAAETPGGALRITGSHELSMAEYGLNAPRLFMGTLKVHDRVKVNFDLQLEG